MKKLTTLSALLATVGTLTAQDAAPADKTAEPSTPAVANAKTATTPDVPQSYKDAINAFSNLPEAQRQDFLKKRAEAGVLFQNKRIIECLELLRDISTIFDNDPQVLNMRGACFVEIRDFPKAMQAFKSSMAITGPNLNVMFNMGEVAFVDKDWKRSLELFTTAHELAVKNEKAKAMQQIIELKQLLCHIALQEDASVSEAEKAEHAAKIEEFSKLYSHLDDTPYFYYAKASIHFSKDEEEEGKAQLDRARRVYSNNKAALLSWEDTLSEYGYIESFYNNTKKEK